MKDKKNKNLCFYSTPFLIFILMYSITFGQLPYSLSAAKASVKTITSNLNSGETVYLGGYPLGVRLNTKGVLIVALCDVQGLKGKTTSPASISDIRIGDSIIKIDGVEVNSTESAEDLIKNCGGNELTFILDRNGSEISKKVLPIYSNTDRSFKVGLWIRDSTSGIGTMTFYHGELKKFAALGHPITDMDTGVVLKVNNGEIIESSIVSVRKGVKGFPGELKGIFIDEKNPLGTITDNSICGIIGQSERLLTTITKKPKQITIGTRDTIREGSAKILTTIDGREPTEYDINIEKLLFQNSPGPKSMLIRITDERLLKETGGIVQGMSGSPIIQDGKLVGAVTHVLINKPDTGYGIYIDWMLKNLKDK